jgi:subtilisin family serine protease
VGPASPLIALVDSGLDATHPEIATGSNITTTGTQPVTDLHGTATAIVAAAPLNGVGILGVWPGARATNFAVPQHRDPATGTEQLYCSDSTAQIAAAVAAGAAVISMSYGSLSLCIAEYVEVQRAVQKGAIPVAASGNENAQGDPLEYPAALPHVLTVGAVDGAGVAAPFSNRSPAVDLSAPGVGVLTGVPLAFDTDGTVDGYMALSGTSFATPMVAAAAAWVRDSRPDLTPDQVAQTLRLGARDVGRPGWSSDTGYGVLSVAGALAQPAPTDDPDEPNDDILFVDGRAFGKAAKRIFTGGRTAKLTARLDQYEDPSDVYRIRLSPRSRVRVSIKPSQGDPDLYVFAGKAQAITSKRVLAKSKKRGLKTDSVSVRNTSGKAMSAYVVAVIDSSVKTLNATYALTVKRAG